MTRLGIVGGTFSAALILTALGVLLHGLGQGNGDEVMAGLMMLVSCLSPGLKEWLATFRVVKDWSKEPPEPVPKPVEPQAAPPRTKRKTLYPSGDDYWPQE